MSLIRIAIDGNEANVSQKVGSNSFAFHILCELEKLTAQRDDIEVTVLLTAPANDQMPPERLGWQYRSFGPSALWTQFALPIHLFFHQHKYDVLFTPGHYAPRVSSVPYVSSVMDLAFLQFPNQFRRKDYLQLREWTRYSVKHAKKIIAISEYTKQDIVRQYHIKPSKIIVAYPGIDVHEQPHYKEKERVVVFKKLNVQHPYILYVGTLQPRKNLIRVIDAFEELFHQLEVDKEKKKGRYNTLAAYKLEDLRLVIAGKTGWLAEPIMERIQRSPLKKRIVVTGFVTEQEKIILYRESLCTVLVGLYEGFGMPALEAMAHRSIPIVSNSTSLPEVVGEAGLQVDPTHVDEIAAAIREVLEMPAKEHAKLLKKARQQVKKFKWQTSAEVILETLLSLPRRK
jgi:glycosyltransferase involved in cell wall biosynthesis